MEQKKFNRSEHMKAKYAEKKKKILGINSSVLEKSKTEKSKIEKEKKDDTIKAQILKEKRKIYSARAYLKRKSLKNKGLSSKKQNSSLKDEKELVFKINNPEKKSITIRIDI